MLPNSFLDKSEYEDKDNRNDMLMYAAYNGNIEELKLLLNEELDINKKDKNGKTAIMYAIESGNINAISLILANNPDLSIKDNNGWNAQDYAKLTKDNKIVELIKNARNMN